MEEDRDGQRVGDRRDEVGERGVGDREAAEQDGDAEGREQRAGAVVGPPPPRRRSRRRRTPSRSRRRAPAPPARRRAGASPPAPAAAAPMPRASARAARPRAAPGGCGRSPSGASLRRCAGAVSRTGGVRCASQTGAAPRWDRGVPTPTSIGAAMPAPTAPIPRSNPRRPPRGGDALLRIDDVVRVFGRGEGEVRALDGVSARVRPRHVHRRHGAVGLGQVDAAADRRRPGPRRPRAASSSATATWRR